VTKTTDELLMAWMVAAREARRTSNEAVRASFNAPSEAGKLSATAWDALCAEIAAWSRYQFATHKERQP